MERARKVVKQAALVVTTTTPTPPPMTASHDILIVGAGVVGSALAHSLGHAGLRVLLVERNFSEPDRIVGELLQPGGVRALRKLGLLDCLEGIDAVPVEGYQCFYQGRAVPIRYPVETDEEKGTGVKSCSGLREGRSFHHGKFVMALRDRAKACVSVEWLEGTVKELVEDPQTGRVLGAVVRSNVPSPSSAPAATETSSTTSTHLASVTIVADGCFSSFRSKLGSLKPTVRSNFVGLVLKDAPLPAPRHGHVILGGPGPVLLYQIGQRDTRILMDVPGKLPSAGNGDLKAYIQRNVVPGLPSALHASVLDALENNRLRSMPNSFLPPSMQGKSKEGVIVVGDAMNMRHPLTGGGMSVGLSDCVFLTDILRPSNTPDLLDWRALRPKLAQWHWKRKRLSSVINILAQALYSLFGADDENLEVLREGCFKYFELGGECVGGPIRLLSGLAPSPLLLVSHFFAVAVYAIYALFTHPRPVLTSSQSPTCATTGKPHPLSSRPATVMRRPSVLSYPSLLWRSVLVFYTACVVIFPVIWTELTANVARPPPPSKSLANSFSTSSATQYGLGICVAALVGLGAVSTCCCT